MIESELIGRARQEDETAWEALVYLYQEPVFRLAYLLLDDAADAEDVAQEAFIRAYRALHSFDPERPSLVAPHYGESGTQSPPGGWPLPGRNASAVPVCARTGRGAATAERL